MEMVDGLYVDRPYDKFVSDDFPDLMNLIPTTIEDQIDFWSGLAQLDHWTGAIPGSKPLDSLVSAILVWLGTLYLVDIWEAKLSKIYNNE